MVSNFIRPYIRELTPYSTARDEFQGVADIFLDANENPFSSCVNRYPDPRQRALKERISALKGVPIERIFLGNGSDEAIDLLVRVTSCQQSGITITPPTYGMYRVAAEQNGIPVIEAPQQEDFALDMSSLEKASDQGSVLLFLCSPNNPTGRQLTMDEIREVLTVFKGIVVVDEAYVEFGTEPSATTLLGETDRLVVLQTFSKAWGMAGARLGMAFADREIIEAMNKVKLPYNVSELTQRYAIERLREPANVKEEVRIIVSERERMKQELTLLPMVERVFVSQGNFLLVKVREPGQYFKFLRERGIVVRDRSKEPGCEGCLRITIGTVQENDALLSALQELV